MTAELTFEGERVDPTNHHHVGAVRVRLCARVREVAERSPGYFAAGYEAPECCVAGAFFIPDRVPIFMHAGLTDGFTEWNELDVRTAIALAKLTWEPGNGRPELSAVERLARTTDPYMFTIYDPPSD